MFNTTSWQDLILSIGGLFFVIALLPSVFSKNKPALLTSVMNGVILAIFAVVYCTLSLWFSAFTLGMTCITWFILAIQKGLQKPGH